MPYIIYKITCSVNQKCYIGFSSRSAIERLERHLQDARKADDLRKFYCAIREHGQESFFVEEIYASQDIDHVLTEMEDYFIQQYDSIKNGYNTKSGGGGRSPRNTVPVEMYDKDKNLIQTFAKGTDCAKYLSVASSRISMACINARNNKASQVKGRWVCFAGSTPVYKTPNAAAGCAAARIKNTGKKRPEHSKYMQAKLAANTSYHIPEGWFTLKDASTYYSRDLLNVWCNNPDTLVTKASISNSKCLNIDTHGHWIGKTKRELGFYRLPTNGVFI